MEGQKNTQEQPSPPAQEPSGLISASIADLIGQCQAFAGRSLAAITVTEGPAHITRYVNPAFCRASEKPRDVLLGRPLVETFPEFRSDGLAAMLDRVYRTGEGELAASQEHAGFPGSPQHWTDSVSPILDRSERPVGLWLAMTSTAKQLLTHFCDRTVDGLRKVNEQIVIASLREQELAERAERQAAQWNALLESMTEGVIVADAEGRVILLNAVGRQFTGWGAEEDASEAYREVQLALRSLDDQLLPFDEYPLSRALRGERFTGYEVIMSHPDESRRRLSYNGSAIRDAEGKVVLAICVFQDVTELRELEEMREDFLHSLSHDLRSPLAVILGRAGMIQRSAGSEKRVRQHAEIIVACGRQMSAMVQDLLEAARLESGQLNLNQEPLDLAASVLAFKDQLVESHQFDRIRVVTPASLPLVPADSAFLARIFTNLLTNALKYSTPGTTVTVTLAQRDGEVVTSVADHGPGIAPSDLPHLFQKYAHGFWTGGRKRSWPWTPYHQAAGRGAWRTDLG